MLARSSPDASPTLLPLTRKARAVSEWISLYAQVHYIYCLNPAIQCRARNVR